MSRRMRLISVSSVTYWRRTAQVVPEIQEADRGGRAGDRDPSGDVRYFMTIREACDLVITAASHALAPTNSAVSVYVLNMGQPVKIVELAERMIRLSGLQPGYDIDIVFSGMRPGERLNEILFASKEPTVEIGVCRHHGGQANELVMAALRNWIGALEAAIDKDDPATIKAVLKDRCLFRNSRRRRPERGFRAERRDRKRRMDKPGKIVVVSQHYPPDAHHDRCHHGRDCRASGRRPQRSGTFGHARLSGRRRRAVASGGRRRDQKPHSGQGGLAPARGKRDVVHDPRFRHDVADIATRRRRADRHRAVHAAYAVAVAARLKRARSALVMHDLYPDVLVMAGLLKPASPVTPRDPHRQQR